MRLLNRTTRALALTEAITELTHGGVPDCLVGERPLGELLPAHQHRRGVDGAQDDSNVLLESLLVRSAQAEAQLHLHRDAVVVRPDQPTRSGVAVTHFDNPVDCA